MKDSPTAHLQVVGPLITPQLATSVTASCINFVIIMILNLMYEKVAIWITDMGEGQRGTSGFLRSSSCPWSGSLLSCLFNCVCVFQKFPRPTWSMRTSWQWRCSSSSLSTTTPPASMWPSSRASLSDTPANTLTCLASGANWGMKRCQILLYYYYYYYYQDITLFNLLQAFKPKLCLAAFLMLPMFLTSSATLVAVWLNWRPSWWSWWLGSRCGGTSRRLWSRKYSNPALILSSL